MADGVKGYTAGKAADDDLHSKYTDTDGTMIRGNGGDDVLRGGKYDDILVGGSGDDWMYGGGGADQFRFFGNEIAGASDRDRIFDLTFADGDTLVFGNYASGTFADSAGVNAFAGGGSAIISSFGGIVEAAAHSSLVTAFRFSPYNDNLIFSVSDGLGHTQEILISNGWSAYVAAGGTNLL